MPSSSTTCGASAMMQTDDSPHLSCPGLPQYCPVYLLLTTFDDHGADRGCWESVRAAQHPAGARIPTIACGLSSPSHARVTKGLTSEPSRLVPLPANARPRLALQAPHVLIKRTALDLIRASIDRPRAAAKHGLPGQDRSLGGARRNRPEEPNRRVPPAAHPTYRSPTRRRWHTKGEAIVARTLRARAALQHHHAAWLSVRDHPSTWYHKSVIL